MSFSAQSPSRPNTVSRPVLRILTFGLALVLAGLSAALPAAAEQPSRVVTALRTDGVFIHNNRDVNIDRDALRKVVEDAADLGYKMAIVIPLDPLPDLRSFVLRVQQGGEFDIVLGFGLEGQIEAEVDGDLSQDRREALAAVRESDSGPEILSALFLTDLTTDPPAELPSSVRSIINWVIILVGLLGVAMLLEWIVRARFPRRRTPPSEPSAFGSTQPPVENRPRVP